MNPPKAERAKPSLSSDYNLLFKNKIGESSLDIHRDYTTDLRKYIIGWFNFYKLAQFKGWAREIDQWIRRRIRMIYWKRWKKIRTKYETLKKRGIDKQKAWEWANTSKKYWRVACSPILHLALGDAFLEKQGWTWIGLAGAPVEWSAC